MKLLLIAFTSSILLLSGCSTVTEAGYYWGDYSSTLYQYTKSPSEKTMVAHEAELQSIIEVSAEKELKVPPGIYAELGYLKSKMGDDSDAVVYFEQEAELYPESKVFLDRLTQSAGDAE